MNTAYPLCSYKHYPGHRSSPMRGRFALRVKIVQLQATACGPGADFTILKSILGTIGTRSVASFDTRQGTSTIQIAIAGDKG